jgi:protein ImuB
MHWIALQAAPELPGPEAAVADGLAPLSDAAGALAWWALQFTPLVAWVEQSLVLEVSSSERLFGGREALLERLFAAPPAATDVRVPAAPVFLTAPARLQHAQGATSLLALARLWTQSPQAPMDSLPLRSLAAARPHLPTLERLGCSNWGQLRALPRAGLVRRFGADLVEALDRAYGLRPEPYAWLTLPEVFDAPLELSAAVESASALLFGARRLLAQLQVWLRARQRGVLALELLWDLDARRSNALHVDAHHRGDGQGRLELRTAQATQDMAHLQRLLAEQLARVVLPAPVLYLRLRSLQTQPLGGDSHSLLPEDQRPGDSLHQMLERLSARLGREQVLCVQPQARHLPEQMQSWLPWTPHPIKKIPPGAVSDQAALLPTWLLAQPQPLQLQHDLPQYHGPLTLLAGPQRLETGWLEGESALRDYFVARSAEAGLLWIFRERLVSSGQKNTSTTQGTQGLRWYLHGLFA